MQVLIDSLSGVDHLSIVSLLVSHADGGVTLSVVRMPGGWALQEYEPLAPSVQESLGVSLDPGVWRELTLEWTFGPPGDGGAYTITVDGARQPLQSSTFDTSDPLQTRLALTPFVVDVPTTVRVHYDNVVCDMQR
jgi:hypothetical protein